MPLYVPTSQMNKGWDLPSWAVAQNIPRAGVAHNSSANPTSGQLIFTAMYFDAGFVINRIGWVAGATGMTTGTNQWFAIYSSALAKLAVTTNDTSTAWAARTRKDLAITGTYTIPSSGLYYIGLCVTATTTPTLMGPQPGSYSIMIEQTPILCGTSTTGLTTPATAPATAAALTSVDRMYYCYVT